MASSGSCKKSLFASLCRCALNGVFVLPSLLAERMKLCKFHFVDLPLVLQFCEGNLICIDLILFITSLFLGNLHSSSRVFQLPVIPTKKSKNDSSLNIISSLSNVLVPFGDIRYSSCCRKC